MKRYKSDGDKSDVIGSQKSDINKSDRIEKQKSDNKKSVGLKQQTLSKSVIEADKINQSKNYEPSIKKEIETRSDRINGLPKITYNEYDFENDHIYYAQSIDCKIPESFQEIKYRGDRKK